MEIDQKLISKIADYFTIVHHTPGRIRLRASTQLKKEFNIPECDAKKAIEILKNIPVIKEIKLNIIIGSITIQYDPKQFEPSLWESWIKKEQLDQILLHIQTSIKGLQP